MQEQESSRLHHLSQPQHSQQYISATDFIVSDDDELVDNSLELSIKAKPFIPQYATSPQSQSQSQIGQSGSLLHQGQSQLQGHGYLSNTNSNTSLNMNTSLLHGMNNNLNKNVASGIGVLNNNSQSTVPINQSNIADPWGSIGSIRSQNSLGEDSQNNGQQMRGPIFEKHGNSGISNVNNMGGSLGITGGIGSVVAGSNSGFNISLLSPFGGIASPLGTSPRKDSGHSTPYSQSSSYSILNGIPSDRNILRDRNPGQSSYSSNLGSSGNRGPPSDQYGGISNSNLSNNIDTQDTYSDVPSLLSGLMSNKGVLGLGSGISNGCESYSSDRFSRSLDSDDTTAVFGIRDQDPYREQGMNHLSSLGSVGGLGGIPRSRIGNEDPFGLITPLPSGNSGTGLGLRTFQPNINISFPDGNS